MNNNNTNDQLSSSNHHDIPVSTRRSSSRISSKNVSSSRHRSGVQRGILKTNVSHSSRKSSKGTPQLRRKKKEQNIDADVDVQSEMDYDDVNNIHNLSLSEDHDDQQQNLLDLSIASADTIIDEDLNKKKKLQKRAIEYFTPVNNTDRVKCSICLRVRRILFLFFY
jgi:hypothetical protein